MNDNENNEQPKQWLLEQIFFYLFFFITHLFYIFILQILSGKQDFPNKIPWDDQQATSLKGQKKDF